MKRALTAIVMSMSMSVFAAYPTGSQAQLAQPEASPAKQPEASAGKKFSVEYREPRYQKIYERVKQRKILEELAEFMSPLRLKNDLKLMIDDESSICRDESPNSFYSPSTYTVHICYNWFEFVEGAAVQRYTDPRNFVYWLPAMSGGERVYPTLGRIPGFTRGDVLIGGNVSNILHELGHAVRHNLDLPRLGREEDTADEIAGFLMLQFGNEVALPTIKGAINVWHHLNAYRLRSTRGAITAGDQEDVHSLDLQRGLNYLCLAYGSPHSAAFKELADRWLPNIRKANCVNDYNRVKLAFEKTILEKHVDPVQLKKVQGMKILQPGDMK
jgi:hypothetical protein